MLVVLTKLIYLERLTKQVISLHSSKKQEYFRQNPKEQFQALKRSISQQSHLEIPDSIEKTDTWLTDISEIDDVEENINNTDMLAVDLHSENYEDETLLDPRSNR